jgi:metal binding Ada-like protein
MIPERFGTGKIEPKINTLMLPAIVILVGLGAFGLGRLSAGQPHQALRIVYPNAQLATPVKASEGDKTIDQPFDSAQGLRNFVASKNGTKYYLTTCSGANRIKEENKVYFASAAQAQAAGYGPAANCPGL